LRAAWPRKSGVFLTAGGMRRNRVGKKFADEAPKPESEFRTPAAMKRNSFLIIAGLACVADAYIARYVATSTRAHRSLTGAERAPASFMTFGFEQCTDAAAVRKRYRELANELHPDRPGGDLDSFKLMADAYKRRLNTMSKLSSDAELKDALAELAAVLLALFKQAVQEAMAGSWKLITGVQEAAAEVTRDGSASRYDSASRDDSQRVGAPSTVRVGAPRRVLNAIGNVFKGITDRNTDRGTAEPPPPSPPPADDRRRQQPFKPAPPSKLRLDRRTEPPRKRWYE
jgi:hypothetical protein